MRIKLFDYFAIIASIIIITLFLIFSMENHSLKKQAHIVSSNTEWYYPLDENRTVNIAGPIGTTIIKIEDNGASIIDSPCPDKICIHQGIIHESGQWIACLPNQVLITIKGETDVTKEETTDDISF